MDKIDLSKQSRFLCGRVHGSERVDIDLGDGAFGSAASPGDTWTSTSRQHAVLQHAYDGSLWIYDLGSSHGTQINHQRVQPWTFQQLLPENSVCFGRSKRHYVVRYGVAVGSKPDSFVNMATSAIESGNAYQQPKAKNHYSDLAGALRSAANAVKSRSKHV